MTDTIVIYHGGCRDGFCAAWIVNKYFTTDGPRMDEFGIDNIKYYAGFYGQEPPDCYDKDVIIVDFCYPLEFMKKIANEAKNLIWLDHHKTAQSTADWFNDQNWRFGTIFDFRFDIQRSGAGLAWDYFFPIEPPRPWIVNYVEDRDLWNKKLEYTDEVNAYIGCLEFNFDTWDRINNGSLQEIIEHGHTAIMKTEQYVREVCKNSYFANFDNNRKPTIKELDAILNDKPRLYDNMNIPVVNICQVDCSEVLHELCIKYPESPFSLYWFKRQDGLYQYGLRSIGDFDVSMVAQAFGGGGHKNAAGFQLPYLLEELK